MSVTQTARILSTYTGDTSGVCSALFECGGMVVMHDASGCNSTYNTHDEPRWYDTDSLVFISALTETDAMLGNDEKLIGDVVEAAKLHHPRFIAVAGTPIPMMTGTDFDAVARRIESLTGIPTFGFATNGMHSYVSGASMAFAALANRLCNDVKKNKNERLSVNLLGMTPLDFSVVGSDASLRSLLEEAGFHVNGVWAMGSEWEDLENAAYADVDLVVSSCGLAAAKVLKTRFGIPFCIGAPFGDLLAGQTFDGLRKTAPDGVLFSAPEKDGRVVIIGESVTAYSLACALYREHGVGATVLTPVETPRELLLRGCVFAPDEDDILPYLKGAKVVVADPLYEPLCPAGVRFVRLPHEAFSGRLYRKEIPDLFCRGACETFLSRIKEALTETEVL